MGLAASQARLLTLTSRKSDVEGRLMSIANQKLALSRDSAKLSTNYSDALSSKKLTWDVADGTKTPLTYDLLMTQNNLNTAGQYFIADSRGRVILDTALATKMGVTGKQGANSGLTSTQFLQNVMGDTIKDAKTAQAYVDEYTGVGDGTSEVKLDTMGAAMASVLSFTTSSPLTQTYNDGHLEGFTSALKVMDNYLDQEIQALSGITDDQLSYLSNTDKFTNCAYNAAGDSIIDDVAKAALGCKMTTTTTSPSGAVTITEGTTTAVKATAVMTTSGFSIADTSFNVSVDAAAGVKSVQDNLYISGGVIGLCERAQGSNGHADHVEDNSGVTDIAHYNVLGTRVTTLNDGTTRNSNVVYVYKDYSSGKYSNLIQINDYGTTPIALKTGSDTHWDSLGLISWGNDYASMINASTGQLVDPNSSTRFTTGGAQDKYTTKNPDGSTSTSVFNESGYSAKYKELQYLVRMQRGVQAIQKTLDLYKSNPDPRAMQELTVAITLLLKGGSSRSTGIGNCNEPENFLANSGDNIGPGSNAFIANDGDTDATWGQYLDYNFNGVWTNTACGATTYGTTGGRSNFTENLTDLFSNYKTVRTNREEDDDSDKLPNISTAYYYLNLWNAMQSQGWVLVTEMDNDTTGKALQNLILNGQAYIYQHQNDGSWELTSTSDTDTPMNEESDENAITAAEADYEARKDVLDYKESKLDVNMSNLDTERTAITTEMESVQKVIDSNIKRLKIFDA